MAAMNEEITPRAGLLRGHDDVEGHVFGAINPTIARELARAHEHDIERDMVRSRRQYRAEGESRGSLIGVIRRVRRRR